MFRIVLVFESIQIRALKKWLSDGESCEDKMIETTLVQEGILATSNL